MSAHPASPPAGGLDLRAAGDRVWARSVAIAGSPVRLAAFLALGMFGALRWSALVAPAPEGRAILPVLLVVAGAPAMVAARRIAERPRRAAVLAALAVAQVVGVMLAAGVPLRLLVPDAWGDLASGLEQGISALPGLNVPYRGADEWVRTVLLLGGGLIVLAAGWLAFGRRGRAGAAPPVAAATQLVALYAVPIVEHGPERPFLEGALLSLLLVLLLWGERIVPRQARLAAVLALATTAFALALGPRVEGTTPLLDYREIAASLEAGGSTAFDWNHGYGPLDWPRDGREVLRVRARTGAYWKAAALETFDGLRWRAREATGGLARDREFGSGTRSWFQTIRVVVRRLRSHEYIGAGTTEAIFDSPRTVITDTPGTFVTGARPLQPGDSYRARVYVPRPSAGQLRRAGTAYPPFVTHQLDMVLPESVGGPVQGPRLRGTPPTLPPAAVRFPVFGSAEAPLARSPEGFVSETGAELVRASSYRRTYDLARSLAREAETPYDLVRLVQRRVGSGASYSERPEGHAIPLDAFLFDDRSGYCQHFSGAMALLLRMAGIPARVASGFTPGSLDRRRGDYVVRDVDAHSWVEVYFPRHGWVPFDPTPAVAPPRSQAAGDQTPSAATGGLGDTGGALRVPGDRPVATTPLRNEGRPWWYAVLASIGLLLVAAPLALRWRRRRPAAGSEKDIDELVRALRRTRRLPAPNVTLTGLETILSTYDGGGDYVRAVRDHRYAGVGTGPTAADRVALRRSLAAGLGITGRLRAWWALPPRSG